MEDTQPAPRRPKKKAKASIANMRRIFTQSEGKGSTLGQIELEISRNIQGFLEKHVIAEEVPPYILERDFLDAKIPEDPMFVSEQADFLLNKVVAQSVNTSSPTFIGHMTSAVPAFMLSLAKIMMGLNQNLVKIETSKAFTPLERQVVAMLHHLVYQRSDQYYLTHTQNRESSLGMFCSGGTIANLASLWVARNRKLCAEGTFGGVERDGLAAAIKHYNLAGLAVLVSRRGHYSLSKSVDLLGIGKKNLVAVATDQNHRICLKDLRRQSERLKEKNIGILAVVGIAGSTETGSVDPLANLADFCREEACHFHVDAAWGGPTLFSQKHAPMLRGIERADSVTLDAHKQLYTPIGAGVALFSDHSSSHYIEHNAQYIVRAGSRDLGKQSLEGSRSGMAMLVHSGLRVIGRSGYEMLIDLGIEKAKIFAAMIEARPEFELMSQPQLNLLTYRYVPKALRPKLADPQTVAATNGRINKITTAIQKLQRAAGKTFVSRTTLTMPQYAQDELTVFRVVLANPLTTKEDLQDILDEQARIGNQLTAGR